MTFRVLGPVEARAAGQSIALGRGHRRTILAVLLAAGGDTVTTNRLIDAVWPHDPPASAHKSLQSHLSRLRTRLSQVGSSPLVSEPDGYRIDLERHDLDAARFESLVAQARERRDRSPAQAEELLLEALELWRGPAFGDLADHPAIRAEAVRLENLRATASAEHTDLLLALGRQDELIGELERAIAEDPLSERPRGQLMVALYRSGRQSDALATYRALQDRLRDELGVDPSPELRDLHERILRQDPALAAPPASGDQIAVGGRRPPPVATAPELIGRDDDIASIAARIEPGCLVTLTGPGGVGKTRLAEQVAARVADRFDDGLAVATLAATRDPGSVGAALITALGIQPTGEQSATETLITALGERQLLLLMDNCEHVLDAVTTLVGAILGHCPNVAILATSRERLHLAGERLWPVVPLRVPDRDANQEEVAATSAGALFRVRAEEAEPSFALTDANAPAVAALCRGLDGMPLAIELAAARVRAMAPEDLVARLDRRFSLLAGGPRHEAGRHRTLQAVVAWSYELLDPLEARLFDRLSVFAGTFSLESAEQVCVGDDIDDSDVAGLMGELVDKSMVVVERRPAGVRYRLLDTLREYGTHRLATVDDPETWRRSHADHHVQLAELLGPCVRGPEEATAVVELDAVFDDVRAAYAWLAGHKDTDGALRIPAALGDYLVYRLRDEVTTWARRAVALPGAAGHPLYALALTTAAFGATSRDECDRAQRDAEEALAHAAADSMAVVVAHAVLTTVALYEGRIDDMLRHTASMGAAAERLAVPFYVAYAGVCRVIGHTYRGEPEQGLAYVPGLQEAAEASGSPTMRAFAHYSRGEALLELQPREAAAALEEAVHLAQKVDNALIWGVSMVSLASLRGRLGETQEALRQFRPIIVHWRRLGDHTHQLTTLRNLVVLLAEMGADEPAAVLHGAVTAGVTPSFGLEAQRLDDAWAQVEARLGSAAATAAAEQGRALRATQVGRVALGYIDELIDS